MNHSATLGVSTLPLPKRSTFLVTQTLVYAPEYLYGLFPTPAGSGAVVTAPQASEYHLDESESLSYSTRVTVAHGSNFGNR